MPRFYCPLPLAAGALIDLPANVAHHAWVVRLQPGAALTLFNGEGGEYAAQLATLDKKSAAALVGEFEPRECELPYSITLAQALPEASKMDWIMEKAVELGVAAIQPLTAQRSVVRLSGERADKRQRHWQAVIVAAAEQSGRNRITALAPLASFDEWVAQPVTATRVLLSPRARTSLAGWAGEAPPQSVCLMVGPEGGFTAQEEQAAESAGALLLSMGPRILRTETAALAALAALSGLWNGMA
jgi:16S rRNA (uracil1498-N3)-methyltransferase